MPDTRIEDVQTLRPYVRHLKRLGYRTTDQLVGAVQSSGDLLAAYLGISVTALNAFVLALPQRLSRAGIEAPAEKTFGRSARPHSAQAPGVYDVSCLRGATSAFSKLDCRDAGRSRPRLSTDLCCFRIHRGRPTLLAIARTSRRSLSTVHVLGL